MTTRRHNMQRVEATSPAASRGLRTALIRRDPWALLPQHDLDAARVPSVRIASLDKLPELIGQLS